MKLLIAEDDAVSRRLLAALLVPLRVDLLLAADGEQAWQAVVSDAPPVILLDWNMPGLTGLEICTRLRQRPTSGRPYVVMVTAKGSTDDIVSAFAAGADDYVTKPYEPEQLLARVRAGLRLVQRDQQLVRDRDFLHAALTRFHDLPDLVPICSGCKRVRHQDSGTWQGVEQYVSEHAGVHFSHTICPICMPAVEQGADLAGSARS